MKLFIDTADVEQIREASRRAANLVRQLLAFGRKQDLQPRLFDLARLVEDLAPGYQLSLFSLDLGSDFVIDPPFFDEEDFESLERNSSSPVLETIAGLKAAEVEVDRKMLAEMAVNDPDAFSKLVAVATAATE